MTQSTTNPTTKEYPLYNKKDSKSQDKKITVINYSTAILGILKDFWKMEIENPYSCWNKDAFIEDEIKEKNRKAGKNILDIAYSMKQSILKIGCYHHSNKETAKFLKIDKNNVKRAKKVIKKLLNIDFIKIPLSFNSSHTTYRSFLMPPNLVALIHEFQITEEPVDTTLFQPLTSNLRMPELGVILPELGVFLKELGVSKVRNIPKSLVSESLPILPILFPISKYTKVYLQYEETGNSSCQYKFVIDKDMDIIVNKDQLLSKTKKYFVEQERKFPQQKVTNQKVTQQRVLLPDGSNYTVCSSLANARYDQTVIIDYSFPFIVEEENKHLLVINREDLFMSKKKKDIVHQNVCQQKNKDVLKRKLLIKNENEPDIRKSFVRKKFTDQTGQKSFYLNLNTDFYLASKLNAQLIGFIRAMLQKNQKVLPLIQRKKIFEIWRNYAAACEFKSFRTIKSKEFLKFAAALTYRYYNDCNEDFQRIIDILINITKARNINPLFKRTAKLDPITVICFDNMFNFVNCSTAVFESGIMYGKNNLDMEEFNDALNYLKKKIAKYFYEEDEQTINDVYREKEIKFLKFTKFIINFYKNYKVEYSHIDDVFSELVTDYCRWYKGEMKNRGWDVFYVGRLLSSEEFSNYKKDARNVYSGYGFGLKRKRPKKSIYQSGKKKEAREMTKKNKPSKSATDA